MKGSRPDRIEGVLATVRRVRWWVLGASAVLVVVLQKPEPWVMTPAFALFWLSVLVDSARGFRTGWRTPSQRAGDSRH